MGGLLPRGTAAVVGRQLTPEPERELPTDPVAWVTGELDEFLWSKQREVLRSVVENRHTAVPACHGPGKSFIGARAIAWWLAAHEAGEAFAVTTAPTTKQVKAILWRELARAKRRAGLPGRINLDAEWYMGAKGDEELVAFGRKPADLNSPEEAMQAFQGIHARYVLVVADEATGIPPWLWDAMDSLTTNESARVLAIGNPDVAGERFAEVCAPGSGWNVIPIDVYDTPNFTGEYVPDHLRELLPSKQWAAERLERWGEDNPLYQSKVRGRFPDVSDDKVVSPALIRKARELDLAGSGLGAYGLDVARYGDDWTVLYRVRDGVVRMVQRWRKASTAETRKRVQAIAARTPAVAVVVDADGIGGGVYDELAEHGTRAVPFTVNTPAHNPRRFDSRRSEVWWHFREEMEEGLIDLDPDDDDLAAQLQAPRWWLDGRGRIHVETKKEMAKRGRKSPDHADAAIMARFGPKARRRPPKRNTARKRRTDRMSAREVMKRPM